MSNEEVQYGADQIQILEGLEAVRKRPGMYIGTTASRGLHHLVYEIVDNSVDEALAGFCDHIEVTINEDENYNITITCGNSVFNIKSMDYRTFPNREVYNINDFIQIENSVMKKMIKETVFACACCCSGVSLALSACGESRGNGTPLLRRAICAYTAPLDKIGSIGI